jgi:tetratricopeptide (TPR) repeat protein
MSEHLERGLVLLEMERHLEAEQELRGALAEDPSDATAHAALSFCLAATGQYGDATQEAEAAVGAGPDLPLAHEAMARVLWQRNRLPQALNAVEEALLLDQWDEDLWGIKAGILMQQGKWQPSLDAAEEGLAIEPEDTTCANLRAMALRQLGRADEAEQELDDVLANDPEDAWAHNNRGWNALEASDPKAAMLAFQEALRLDPGLENAREGLVQALKSRHLFYRLVLRYYLWVSKLSSGMQWAMFIGLYMSYRFLLGVSRGDSALAPLAMVGAVAYGAFVFTTWTMDTLFNLALFIHPVGRYALTREERASSLVAGGLLMAGVVLILVNLLGDGSFLGFFVGLQCLLGIILVASIANCEEGWPRTVMILYSVGMVLITASAMHKGLIQGDMEGMGSRMVMALLGTGLVGSILGNILSGITPKK